MDTLLKRYGDIVYIMDMEWEDGYKLITTCIEQDVKDKLYIQYCALLPVMTSETWMTFDQFHIQNTQVVPVKKRVTKEEGYSIANGIIGML